MATETSTQAINLTRDITATETATQSIKLTRDITATENSFADIEIRRAGALKYLFELRDSQDTLVDSYLGDSTQTVFTDVFTGLADGDYTLYCLAQNEYTNLQLVQDETFVTFTLASGIIQPKIPNEVVGLRLEAIKNGYIRVEFGYDATYQEIAPTTFKVYVDSVEATTVTYTGASQYTVDIGAYTETSKTVKVTAVAGSSETTGASDTITPDATAPVSQPFTFKRI